MGLSACPSAAQQRPRLRAPSIHLSSLPASRLHHFHYSAAFMQRQKKYQQWCSAALQPSNAALHGGTAHMLASFLVLGWSHAAEILLLVLHHLLDKPCPHACHRGPLLRDPRDGELPELPHPSHPARTTGEQRLIACTDAESHHQLLMMHKTASGAMTGGNADELSFTLGGFHVLGKTHALLFVPAGSFYGKFHLSRPFHASPANSRPGGTIAYPKYLRCCGLPLATRPPAVVAEAGCLLGHRTSKVEG